MPGLDSIQIQSHNLDRLRPGLVVVNAPLEDGAILVRARGLRDTAELAVDIGQDSVAVARHDGNPLQVMVYERSEPFQTVFPEPVDALRLVRSGAFGWWRTERGVVPNDNEELLGKFLHVLGSYAVDKQLFRIKRQHY